jgi:hypothetical protein
MVLRRARLRGALYGCFYHSKHTSKGLIKGNEETTTHVPPKGESLPLCFASKQQRAENSSQKKLSKEKGEGRQRIEELHIRVLAYSNFQILKLSNTHLYPTSPQQVPQQWIGER